MIGSAEREESQINIRNKKVNLTIDGRNFKNKYNMQLYIKNVKNLD